MRAEREGNGMFIPFLPLRLFAVDIDLGLTGCFDVGTLTFNAAGCRMGSLEASTETLERETGSGLWSSR